jgi:hypothetical protein
MRKHTVDTFWTCIDGRWICVDKAKEAKQLRCRPDATAAENRTSHWLGHPDKFGSTYLGLTCKSVSVGRR